MKVAAIQMPTVKDKIQNIRTAGTYIEKIKAENPDFVILPEMFCCPYQTENFPVYAEKEGGPSWQAMSDYARKYHIYLIAGSMPETDESGNGRSLRASQISDVPATHDRLENLSYRQCRSIGSLGLSRQRNSLPLCFHSFI